MAGKVKPAVEDDDLPGEAPKPKKKPAAPIVEEPDESPPPAPKKHAHSQRLTELALHLGYSQSEIEQTPDEALRQELALIQTEIGRNVAPPPAPESKKAVEEPADPDEAYLAELESNSEVDPKHVAFLKRQVAARKAAEAKAAKVDQFEEKEKYREERQAQDSVDFAFAALGKKYEKLVGAGDMAEITDPGEKGWRFAIYQAAKIDFKKDSQRAINRKVAEAAAKLAASKVKDDEPGEDEEVNAYDKPPKRAPAKDPETGRFTTDDFEGGKVAKPSGKKNTPAEMDAVEATRQLLRANGDPRGFRPVIEFDDDLPG